MTYEPLVLILIWSLVTYRVCRFVVLDSLVDRQRVAMHDWLIGMTPDPDGEQSRLSEWAWKHRPERDRAQGALAWLSDLLSCPYCLTIWVSAAVLFSHRLFVDDFPVPIWMWLATAAASLLWWARIDPKT